MDADEQALRDQIAFQFGLLAGAVLKREVFDVVDYVEPIVVTAKKMAGTL